MPWHGRSGAVVSLDNVVMPSGQRGGIEPDGGQPGADCLVELLGDPDRPRAWMLVVDGVLQSHVDLDDPRHLELEYMRRLGHLIDLAAPTGMPLRVLHLGGGGLTLARYVAVTRPGSHQLAVESDAEVARLVRRRLPLDRPGPPRAGTGQIGVRVADARTVVEQRAVGHLRSQRRRWPAAGSCAWPGGCGAFGVRERLRGRGGCGAARPQVRQPGGRR